MMKADLHIHSRYSEHPTDWFLQKLGTRESYTEPDTIYETCKKKGMDLVTITDHNKIEGVLLLAAKHEDVITGVELTTYFPEDGCKVHILVYGFTREQFDKMDSIRSNIYILREYLLTNNLACSVAHATYPLNSTLSVSHLERLFLLFNVFEIANGGRSNQNNKALRAILSSLNPTIIDELQRKHGIEPYGESPWKKGFMGGSDDHAGLFIANSYTCAEAATADEFLEELRARRTEGHGEGSTFQWFAFTMYKTAYDFSRTAGNDLQKGLFSQVNDYVFGKNQKSLLDTFKLRQFKLHAKKKHDNLRIFFADFLETARNISTLDPQVRLDILFDKIGLLLDEYVRLIINKIYKATAKGDIIKTIQSVSSMLPSLFILAPFFTSLSHINMGWPLARELSDRWCEKRRKKILWFTDTINDMNGVSFTLTNMAAEAHNLGYPIALVVSIPQDERKELPPNTINLPILYDFKAPFYADYTIRVPTLLGSLKRLYSFEPDEIYISTPGFLGMFGLLFAKLSGIKASGIFHTDFMLQARDVTQDNSLAYITETYVKFAYSLFDEIRVPTRQYVDILRKRGYDAGKMKVFRRGIDLSVFKPRSNEIARSLPIGGGDSRVVFIYTGRVSREKKLDFLLDVFASAQEERNDISLVICGDGPYLHELKKWSKHIGNVYFTGPVKRNALPEYLNAADIFLFPSITDTFGMSVLEAQACGLPAVVSTVGGPCEIIENGVTGYAVNTDDHISWKNAILFLAEKKRSETSEFETMREKAIQRVRNNFSWASVLESYTRGNDSDPVSTHSDWKMGNSVIQSVKAREM